MTESKVNKEIKEPIDVDIEHSRQDKWMIELENRRISRNKLMLFL